LSLIQLAPADWANNSVRLACGWLRIRRSSYQLHGSTKSLIAAALLARAPSLDPIEAAVCAARRPNIEGI
jgi:hypothetical protein